MHDNYHFEKKVCFPGLHLSLGIFNRLWILLEEECTEVDLALAQESAPGGGGGGGGGSTTASTGTSSL